MRFNSLPAMVGAAILAGGLATPAQADFTFNVGTGLSHESNVNGSPDTPTKANQQSDNYGTLNASAVYYTPLDTAKTRYFIGQVGALSSAYNKFSYLDSTMLVTSAGLYQQLSPTWSGLATARGFTRDVQLNALSSNGFGGTLEIKNQLTQTLWIKGIADYEDSTANLGAYSYTGNTYGMTLGYLPLEDTFFDLGYSHAKRDFQTTPLFSATAQTLYAEVTQRIAKNWYLTGSYAYQDNKSNIVGTAYTDNIVSVGVKYSY